MTRRCGSPNLSLTDMSNSGALVQFFVVLEKFSCAYLFQIALEII